ncbi:putative molybdenum carrier protein [candidate division WOR-3 bacterium]|nr:putative molybdenum carrier protein [candidate division WOR-3 bacterium]
MKKIQKKLAVCSGGQTGIDRAALDAASELGLVTGGWCPKGRRAEDGEIPLEYRMIEASSSYYWERTLLNVAESDATLILTKKSVKNSKGTDLTVKYAKKIKKPYRIHKIGSTEIMDTVKWLAEIKPEILNIAGPRESKSPGIYNEGKKYIKAILENFIASR